ncbi:MAG: glycosyltransferase family 2 protein [Lachnospiraceae bacterium]|nr:glycosyltransferase family 2 protein [Lachnospiraceae bacterium]
MKTTLIILNYNDAERTIKLAQTVKNYNSINHIVITDNASSDDSFARLLEIADDKISVVTSGFNGGYAKGNNFGCRYAIANFSPDILFVANPDVAFDNETAAAMAAALTKCKNLGVVAPLVRKGYNVWNLPGFAGIIESLFLVWFTLDKLLIRKKILNSDKQLVPAGVAEGSFFALTAAAFKEAGGFDERTFLYSEEIILASRLKALGLRTGILRDYRYDHMHSASIKKHYNSSKARTFKHFAESFAIYNKHYLHTTPMQDKIYDLACKLAYGERLVYDFIKNHMP